MAQISKGRWKLICVVAGCGKFQVRLSRCDQHAAEKEAERGTPTERGYGPDHAKVRAVLLRKLKADDNAGIVSLCWRCLLPMYPTQELDADHSRVKASEGGRADCLTHARCNRGKRLPPAR